MYGDIRGGYNMYGEDCVTRKESEQMIRNAIEDYLSINQLQEILNIIFDDEIMVLEDDDVPEDEE